MPRRRDDALAHAIGHRVRAARIGAALSQEALAVRLGIGTNVVSNMERGRHTFRVAAQAAVAAVTGTTLVNPVHVGAVVTRDTAQDLDDAGDLKEVYDRFGKRERALWVGIGRLVMRVGHVVLRGESAGDERGPYFLFHPGLMPRAARSAVSSASSRCMRSTGSSSRRRRPATGERPTARRHTHWSAGGISARRIPRSTARRR